MIVESCACQSLTNNYTEPLKTKEIHMAMNKLTIKPNGYSSTNENRTDDDYGGGGTKPNLQIPS